MSEHEKHTAFLRALIHHQNPQDGQALKRRMREAEINDRSLKRAIVAVCVLGLLSGCGICYSAVLLPDFFQNGTHFLIKVFSTVGLGSGICLFGFGAYWFQHRRMLRHLHDDCRRLIMGSLKPEMEHLGVTPSNVSTLDTTVYRMPDAGLDQDSESEIVRLPRAS